jgi:hypothetical protein
MVPSPETSTSSMRPEKGALTLLNIFITSMM